MNIRVISRRIRNLWFSFPEFFRFLIIGGYNTVFGYLLYFLLYFLYPQYIISLIASAVIAVFQNFLVFRFLVFKTHSPWLPSLIKTYLSYFVIFLFNLGLLWFFTEITHISPYIGQLICSLLIPILTYIFLSNFAYKG